MKIKKCKILLILFLFLMCFGLVGCDLSNPSTKSEELIALESLSTDVAMLESISKDYNENSFSKRTLIYVRCKRYNDTSWNTLGGTLENDFEDYVTNNDIESELEYLQTKELFVDTATKQNVDFIHYFATMNLEIINTTLGDLGGFGGDLCQLVKELKELNITDAQLLEETAKIKFNGQSSFGTEDLLADIDAVNTICIYNNLTESNKTIANAMLTYYTNLTQQQRLSTFCQNLFGDNINLNFNDKCTYLFNRLKNNYFISYLCNTYGINFNDNKTEFNICINLFTSYILNLDWTLL